jgi:hypothetical protein
VVVGVEVAVTFELRGKRLRDGYVWFGEGSDEPKWECFGRHFACGIGLFKSSIEF